MELIYSFLETKYDNSVHYHKPYKEDNIRSIWLPFSSNVETTINRYTTFNKSITSTNYWDFCDTLPTICEYYIKIAITYIFQTYIARFSIQDITHISISVNIFVA